MSKDKSKSRDKKVYYKVVLLGGIYYQSAARSRYTVLYKVHEWTYPNWNLPGSKLFVFSNLQNAKNFKDTLKGVTFPYTPNNLFIFECEVKNPKRLEVCASLFHIAEVWKRRKQKKKFSHLNQTRIPSGTVHVDAVKLTKRIN